MRSFTHGSRFLANGVASRRIGHVITFAILAATTVACSNKASVAQQTALPATGRPGSASVAVSAEVAGRTPTHIGYNMGDNFPGSNVSAWLRYAEVNAARVWWPQDAWPQAPAGWPVGANDEAKFETERARLRANATQGFDWKSYESNLARIHGGTPPDTLGHSFTMSELRKMGADVLIMMSRTTSKHTFESAGGAPDWFGRWTYWHGVYFNAFYLSRHYDVERFQLFNEPDHPNSGNLTQPDYLRRLQLGSDAVQAALADVNRLYGKALHPIISAPVTAGMMVFGPRTGRPDTRDEKTGWGELVMRHRRDDFAGRSKASGDLFGMYAFQAYGRNPARITEGLPELRRLITVANGGVPLPIIVSEMNVSTAGDFAKTTETLDTPRYYAAFGAIAAAYVNAGIDEVYVFRLTQADWERGGVKKNGTHIIDNRDPLKTILSSTKGAEAARLFIRGFKGGRIRFVGPTITGDNLYAAAARDATDDTYTLMVANLGASRTLALDLSAWQLVQGALTVVEEVSAAHHGDVSSVLALPAGNKFTLPMNENSIVLVTVRSRLSGTPRSVMPATLAPGTLRVETAPPAGGRVLLALQAAATLPTTETRPATAPRTPVRVRVYGGAGNVAQADLLGQVTLEAKSAQVLVDVTRYMTATKGGPLVFQIVPDEIGANNTSFQISAAELRVFGLR